MSHDRFFERLFQPSRAPEDGAGATPPAAGAGGAADGAASPDPAGAAADGVPPSAAKPYRPQGLPETMFGKDDRETMDKMAHALAGYRTRDSAAPQSADAYKNFDLDTVDPKLKPHFERLSGDPVMDAAAAYAFENKLPLDKVQGLIGAVYGSAIEQGLFEGMVDPAAERAALLPETAKGLAKAEQDAAINARLQANEDFVKLITAKDGQAGGLPKDVAEHALLMLMDTARGNQFLEFFRAQMTGADKAGPLAGAGAAAGADTRRAALRERMAAPEMQPQHPKFDRAAWQALQDDYRKLIAD